MPVSHEISRFNRCVFGVSSWLNTRSSTFSVFSLTHTERGLPLHGCRLIVPALRIFFRLATDCAKNYCNRTLIVKVVVENVVTCFFMEHSVYVLVIWIRKLITKQQISYLTGTCYNLQLEEFLAWFRVARVCQRQLGILVISKICHLLALFELR